MIIKLDGFEILVSVKQRMLPPSRETPASPANFTILEIFKDGYEVTDIDVISEILTKEWEISRAIEDEISYQED